MIRARITILENPGVIIMPIADSIHRKNSTEAISPKGRGSKSISHITTRKISRSFRETALPKTLKITILVKGMDR